VQYLLGVNVFQSQAKLNEPVKYLLGAKKFMLALRFFDPLGQIAYNI
jgi:hypothetical protein